MKLLQFQNCTFEVQLRHSLTMHIPTLSHTRPVINKMRIKRTEHFTVIFFSSIPFLEIVYS